MRPVRPVSSCVGIAAVYLALAEGLHWPIHAVATPSHVFLRYDDGATRINIETLQGGANVCDEQYIREQKIPEESIHRGIFMRNLTADEFLAQVHNNLGVDVWALNNRGLAYLKAGKDKNARTDFEAALEIDPGFEQARKNPEN